MSVLSINVANPCPEELFDSFTGQLWTLWVKSGCFIFFSSSHVCVDVKGCRPGIKRIRKSNTFSRQKNNPFSPIVALNIKRQLKTTRLWQKSVKTCQSSSEETQIRCVFTWVYLKISLPLNRAWGGFFLFVCFDFNYGYWSVDVIKTTLSENKNDLFKFFAGTKQKCKEIN